MTDYDIYREQLSINYSTDGHTLRQPSPSNPIEFLQDENSSFFSFFLEAQPQQPLRYPDFLWQDYVGYTFTPPSPASRIQPPPDKLHPTLSSWLKNINKLDSLINRLQELASSAPVDHRSQLFNKVAELRATFKEQQERCIEFLELSEDYANKYLLDIDAEIRQQSTLLDNLEERLEAAKKLHGDAAPLISECCTSPEQLLL